MKNNYTVTFSVDHEATKLVDAVGFTKEENPLLVFNAMIMELDKQDVPMGMPVASTKMLFDILPKVTPIPESYLLYFMVLGYQRWVDMAQGSIEEAVQRG